MKQPRFPSLFIGEGLPLIRPGVPNMSLQSIHELIGKPVISMTNGQNIGSVADIMIDPDKLALSALVTSKGSLLSRKIEAIRAAEVQVWGIHAVLVSDPDVILKGDELYDRDAWMSFSDDLKSRNVVSLDGARLGAIKDILIDRQGKLTAYELSRAFKEVDGLEQGRIPVEATQSLGQDFLVIDLRKIAKPVEQLEELDPPDDFEVA
jgi:uncharacterized protein YrrD